MASCYAGEADRKQAKIWAEAWHGIAGAIAKLGKYYASMKNYHSKIIAIGEAAAVGASVGVALIGAMEIATSIAAQQWLVEAKHYLDCAPLVGSMVGAIAGGLRIARRRWATAKIAGLSDYTVPIVRTKFEGNLQITKLDKTIGGDGRAGPARKRSADVIPLSMQQQP